LWLQRVKNWAKILSFERYTITLINLHLILSYHLGTS